MNVENIEQLMEGIYEGKIVLPDFQRSFVWKPEQVRELLVSVCSKYFIGSMLAMDSLAKNSEFELRLFEGVEEVNPKAEIPQEDMVKIILDGQQRCTALFYAIYQPKRTILEGQNYPYVFYLDIEKALEGEFDEAVIAVNEGNRKISKEISDRKNKKEIISFNTLWHLDAITLLEYSKTPTGEIDERKHKGLLKISNEFKNFKIHIVDIANTDTEKIVEIFERINRTGKPLSVWDLLAAKLYRRNIKLRELIEDAEQKYEFLNYVERQEILKVIALLRDQAPKRKNLLNLSPKNPKKPEEDFKTEFDKACELLEKAYTRMKDLKTGYGILDFEKWTPYTSMIVPLAVMLNECKNSLDFEKVDKWYWISVFDQRYAQAVDTKTHEDVKEVTRWIRGEVSTPPDFIKNFKPENIDFYTVRDQSNAVYRGVINLITLKGASDFISGEPLQFGNEKIQDDHIFPKSKYGENCILNRTLIKRESNQRKGNQEPSEFFSEIRRKGRSKDRLLEILKSHLISEEALKYLLSNNLKGFMEARKKAIVEEIKSRTSL